MREFQKYLDSLLEKAWNMFQKKEDAIFGFLFLFFFTFLWFEFIKWIYQFLDFSKLILILFFVFFAYALRKHYWTQTKKSKLVQELALHKDSVMYGIFILFFLILVLNFIFIWENGLKYLVLLVLGIFTLLKFLGFKIEYSSKKIPFISENSLYLFIIWGAFLYVVLHYSIEGFKVWELSTMIYTWIGILYFLSYVFIFTDIQERLQVQKRHSTLQIHKFQRILFQNMYLLLSLCCIWILMWVLFFRWDNEKIDIPTPSTALEEDFLQKKAELEALEQSQQEEFRVEIRKVSELYEFSDRLELWSEWEDVQKLQGFLASKWYYSWSLNWIFDEETRVALRNTLIWECEWPDSTRGILWSQASACINNMEVEYKIKINSEGLPIQSTWAILSENSFENIQDSNNSSSIFKFQTELNIGDSGEEVRSLQDILSILWYLLSESDGNFDISTSIALKSALIGQCGFSQDIEGNLDQSAIACLNSLEIQK